MSAPPLSISRRTRRTPFSSFNEARGVKAYTVLPSRVRRADLRSEPAPNPSVTTEKGT